MSEGPSNTEIAERLDLSTSSIKATISSALNRLDLTNRIQRAILAHESHPVSSRVRTARGCRLMRMMH